MFAKINFSKFFLLQMTSSQINEGSSQGKDPFYSHLGINYP